MPQTTDPLGVPQFQTAEFHDQPTGDTCRVCHKPLISPYYRIYGANTCDPCSRPVLAAKARDTHAAFTRAILFGLGGALLGLILYAAIGIVFHVEIGFVSLAVGYLVGKAMMMGSGNIGGRRYQWAAVVLTYAAVSIAVFSIQVGLYVQQRRALDGVPKSSPSVSQPLAQPAAPAPQSGATVASAPPEERRHALPANLGKILLMFLLYGLASPVLIVMGNFAHGVIGLLILALGLRIAWRLATGPPMPSVEGPY